MTTYREAPGALDDEAQTKFTAQILSLVRAYYGEDAQFALAVVKHVTKVGMIDGAAFYLSGSTQRADILQSIFKVAAHSLKDAPIRKLAVEEGEPEKRQ